MVAVVTLVVRGMFSLSHEPARMQDFLFPLAIVMFMGMFSLLILCFSGSFLPVFFPIRLFLRRYGNDCVLYAAICHLFLEPI